MNLQPASQDTATPAPHRLRERGQVVVIFAGAMLLFVLLCAAVVDMSWYWTNNLRMQRAADAAALAGVIFLPGDPTKAYLTARAEAAKNGYADGVNSVVVTPLQDDDNDRRLRVTISGPINTFFARVLGINSWNARRDSNSEYVLPVPMGSPQNYYGVGFFRDAETITTVTADTPTTQDDPTTLTGPANATPTNGTGWTSLTAPTNNANLVADIGASANYVYTTTTARTQQWQNFNVIFPALTGNEVSRSIRGIQVQLDNVRVSSTASCTSASKVGVELNWSNGAAAAWSTLVQTPNLTATNQNVTLGNTANTTPWGAHGWLQNEFTNTNFRIRFTATKGAGCPAAQQIRVDRLRVQVFYRTTSQTYTTTTNTNMVTSDIVSPYGATLAPQNFWAAMQSQGAPNIQGDAYMTKYNTRSGPVANGVDATDPDAHYDWQEHYGYAVEMPPNSAGGEVWIFDPGFCDATSSAGTGENWTVGGTNGYATRQPVSAFYTLEDAGTNLYSSADDGTVYSTSSGNTFKRLSYQDDAIINELGATDPGVSDCGSQSWHYDINDWNGNVAGAPTTPRKGWYLLGSGLTGGPNGTVYRVHSFSTDPNSLSDQDNTTALNAFAIYTQAAAGAVPKVYGLGSMEAYVRLPGGKASEFYLAQIADVHAGKTMVIQLWDPGDTGSLSASLEVLEPGATNYTPVTFTYKAAQGTASASNCGAITGTSTFVVTNTGGSSRFNGCWLTLQIAIPTNYTAPHPTSDSTTAQGGWWKIRYTMGGLATDFSTDLTTWQVDIRGNPVHLVLP